MTSIKAKLNNNNNYPFHSFNRLNKLLTTVFFYPFQDGDEHLMTNADEFTTTSKSSMSHTTFTQNIATEQQSTSRKLTTLTTAIDLTTLKLTVEEKTTKHRTARFYSTTEETKPQSSLQNLTTNAPEETETSKRKQGF